jgi:hypothetical protein
VIKFNKRSYLLNKEDYRLLENIYLLIDFPDKAHGLYGERKYRGIDEYIVAIDNARALALNKHSPVIFRKIRGGDED